MPGLQSISGVLERLQQSDIFCEPSLCSRTRWHHSNCKLCAEGCVTGAVQLSPQLKLDEEKCTSCGICISCCPNGAFWSRKQGDLALAQDIKKLLSDNSNRDIVFSCSRNSPYTSNSILLTCLGRLTETILLAPFLYGAKRVEIRWPQCGGCSYEKSLSHMDDVLFLSRKLAAMIGKKEGSIRVTGVSRLVETGSSISRFSRREFFSRLRADTMQKAVLLFPEFNSSKSSTPWPHFIGAKRTALLKTIRSFPEHLSTPVEREKMPVGEVHINHLCSGCPVCVTLCPTGALIRDEKTNSLDIYFKPGICTGCQICKEACLFQAVSISRTVDLSNLATGTMRPLIHLKTKVCKDCSSDFLSTKEDICPTCRNKGNEAVLSIRARQHSQASGFKGA